MKYCTYCGQQMPDDSRFCPRCGRPVGNQPPTPDPNEPHGTHTAHNAAKGVFDRFNDYIGNDGDRSLNWKMLFTDVTKKHTRAEAEEIFICGTKKTTPPLCDISTSWPHPWLYSRVFLVLAVVYVMQWVILFTFGNMLSLPGMVIVGSFAMPLTILILFLEVNVYKNISFLDVMIQFMVGGCASLVITQILFAVFPRTLMGTQALVVGIVEETSKALIVYYLLKRIGVKYILCGLLVGAAVGAGFSAFESAGYALVKSGGYIDNTTTIIYLRAFLSPGGHIIWAAMSGAGIVMAYKAVGAYKIDLLYNAKFLRIFIIPVVLHTLWDTDSLGGFLFLILLTIVGWMVCLLLVNMGLAEATRVSKAACAPRPLPPAPPASMV